jgi:hypothetical protein
MSYIKHIPYFILLVFLSSFSTVNTLEAQKDSLNITVGKAVLNKSLWSMPYRYENKELKALTIEITIHPTKNVPVDFNEFVLRDEDKKLRIRANEAAYYKADRKIYYKSKATNLNYRKFKETLIDGYTNVEIKTYKTNFLGRKKKKTKSAVKQLKTFTLKGKKATYYIDFPVNADFKYGKIYYDGRPVGFAAVKK